MELEDTSTSRISIGFPLGLALLFALFFFVCLFFCCCLHWDKLRLLFLPSSSSGSLNNTSQSLKPIIPIQMMEQKEFEGMPVLMPGDEVPRFIAMACPRQPLKDHSIIEIQVHNNYEKPEL